MASIPLAANALKFPEQPDPLSNMSRMVQLSSLLRAQPYQQQILAQQAQAGALENTEREQQNQIRAQQIKNQQAGTAAMQEWDGKDINDLPGLYLKHGADANAVMALKSGIVTQKKQLADLDKDTLDNMAKTNDALLGHIDAIRGVSDPEKRAQVAADQATQVLNAGYVKDPQTVGMLRAMAGRQMVPTDDQLDLFEKGLKGHKGILEDAQKEAQTAGEKVKAGTEQLGIIGQTLGNATDQATWDSRRSYLAGQYGISEDQLAQLGIPKEFSPQAAQAAKALGVTPEKQAGLPDVQQYIQNYMKANNMADTPENRLKAHQDFITKTKVVPQVQIMNAGWGNWSPGQTLDPKMKAAVDMVGTGQMDLPTAMSSMRRSPLAASNFVAALHQEYPDYFQGNFGASKKTLEYFTSGEGAKNVNAFNTATEHLNQLSQLANNLGNTKSQAWNTISNKVETWFGGKAPTEFNTVRSAVAGEVGKTFKGMVTDSEIKDIQGNINSSQSPEQMKGFVDQALGLMKSKMEASVQQYTMGRAAQPAFPVSVTSPSNNTSGNSGGAKVLTQVQIQQAAKDHGVSVEEATRQAQAQGYQIK